MIFGKYIKGLYKKYLIFFIIGVLATIAVDWVQLYLPEYLGNVVNIVSELEPGKAIPQDVMNKMLIYLGLIIAIGFALFAGRVIWRFSLFYASKRMEADIRKMMFEKAEQLSVTYYHSNKVGNIMSWFTTDLETIEEFLGWGAIMVADAIFMTIFAAIKMFNCDWMLSLIAIVPILLIAVWGALVEKVMSIKWKERQESFDKVYDYAQESFSGIRVIKAFVKETQQVHAFAKVAKQNKDTNVNFVRVSVVFDIIIEIIITIIFTLILSVGGWIVITMVQNGGAMSELPHRIHNAGDLVAFTGYFDSIIWPMIAMGQVITMYSRAKTSMGRVTNFLDSDVEIHNSENPVMLENCQGKIEFKNFSFKYPDSDYGCIKDVNFVINPGEIVGVVGRVGSGKTTLVNVLLHLFNIEKGTVLIDDLDVMDIDITNLRDNVAYVPQDNFLFSNSLANNISFANEGKEIDNDAILKAAEFSDVADNIAAFPKQYETVSGERGQTLSGGQKQRVAIARAFFKQAPIMIMDDSVSAVDVKTEETILNNIREKRKGKTTILIASRVSTVSHLDKIIVLSNGTLEAFDTPANLMKNSPTYQRMVALQELEKEKGGND